MNEKITSNEQGFIFVTALLMMVVLLIMGTFAMTISNIEQRVTSNSEVFQHNFYAVEAATLEAAARIDQIPDATLLGPALPIWLQPKLPAINLTLSAQWTGNALITPAGTTLNISPVDITPPGYAPPGDRILHAAIDNGKCALSSLTDPTMEERCYDVYGMYDVNRGAGKAYTGRMLMRVGYKKNLYY